MPDFIRLRKTLNERLPTPEIPSGVSLLPLWRARPIELHELLRAAYADGGGTVGDFADWWWPLVEDPEFHPDLLLSASVGGQPIGLIQCWTGGFIKDLVVAASWRNRGIGAFLLAEAFLRFQARGASHVDLKVESTNLEAQRFYYRQGMAEVTT